ncbi:SpoIIE family protein phosphatase [Leptospira idonii]|uniref:Serine/threonine protein phosphatase n=1 Tax=Leptospira idonii TaxID=1193500 RepID=A0A4R9M2N8_9LEPT|nr:SpoIIE family protein phosphatase [Leptospira idonii]TGN21054.1 serine/threonine protein phosphatase [Leptospira idonii]
MNSEDLNFLHEKMTKVDFLSGDLIIEQNSNGDSFYLIEKGLVQVWKYLDDTKEDILELGEFGPGEYFGEIALIDSAPRTVNITAKENCSLLQMTRASFQELLYSNPAMTVFLLRILTARIRNSEQRENQVLSTKNKNLIQTNRELEIALDELRMNEAVRAALMEELRKQNETLEEMVKERTAKLQQSLEIIREDLETAKTIQRSILPLNTKKVANLQFSSRFEPMSEVGGDVFDVFRLGTHKVRLFLADAIGHGVQAALITMAIKAEFDHVKKELETPSEVLLHLNRVFLERYGKRATQFTAVIADIDLENSQLYYSCAGHNEPYILSQGNIIPLEESGIMLGLENDAHVFTQTLPFSEGDRLFMISDGIIEQENANGEFFGEKRLHRYLLDSKDISLEKTVGGLLEAFQEFKGKREMMDDVTILGIGMGGSKS